MKEKLTQSITESLFKGFTWSNSTLNESAIKAMLLDVDIRSALNKIERDVAKKKFYIDTNKEERKEMNLYLESLVDDVDYSNLFNNMLTARTFGYAIFEKIYNSDFSIKDLLFIPQDYCFYDSSLSAWKIKGSSGDIVVDNEKFLTVTHKENASNPLGESVLKEALVAYLDKKLFEDQLRGISQKYGDVIIMFAYDPEDKEEETKRRAEALKKAQGGNVIGVPVEGYGNSLESKDIKKEVEFIKLSDLNPEVFIGLIDMKKKQLLQLILGSTLTMEAGNNGSRALGTVHENAEASVVDEASRFLSSQLKKLLVDLGKLRGEDFGDFYFVIEDEVDTESIEKQEVENNGLKLDNFKKLNEIGYTLSAEYIANELRIPIEDLTKYTTPSTVQFAKEFSKSVDYLKKQSTERKNTATEAAEKEFLTDWTKEINKQIIGQINSNWKKETGILNLNFESFIEHQTIMFLVAYVQVYGETTGEFAEEFNPFAVPYQEAIDYALKMYPALFEDIEDIEKAVRDNCFWIKKSTDLKVTDKLLKELQISIENGGTYKEWLSSINDVVYKIGCGKNGYYLNNVYRTNVQTIYNAGAYVSQKEVSSTYEYWLYNGVGDERQSDVCAELDGKVYRSDDSIWGTHYPPNHYGCRTNVIALSEEDLKDYGLEVTTPSEDVKNLDLGDFEGNPATTYWENLEKNTNSYEKEVEKNVTEINATL